MFLCISMCTVLCESVMPARVADNLLCTNCLFCFVSPFKIPLRSEAQAVIRNFTLREIISDNELEQISLHLFSFLLCHCNNLSTPSSSLSVGMSRSSSRHLRNTLMLFRTSSCLLEAPDLKRSQKKKKCVRLFLQPAKCANV